MLVRNGHLLFAKIEKRAQMSQVVDNDYDNHSISRIMKKCVFI